MNESSRNVLIRTNEYTRALIAKFSTLREESRKLQEKHEDMLENYALSCLHQALPHGTEMRFSAAARNRIRQYEGDLDDLKNSVKNAAVFAANLGYGQNGNMITLEDFHLEFSTSPQPVSPDQDIPVLMTRYTRTIALLDKLEDAAREVINRNLPLTGANVGNACRKAISAPAITDALKKHKQKILSLMKIYPSKWMLIRKEFKPLINILTDRRDWSDNKEKQA